MKTRLKNQPPCNTLPLTRYLMRGFALCALLAVAVPSAFAASKTWNAASGTWNYTAANWVGPTTFTSGDDAIFSAGTADSATTLGTSIIANSLRSNGGSTPATMTINGAASDILTLGTGTPGSGNIVNAAGTGGFEQNLSYNLAGANNALTLAAGSGTSGSPMVWNIASGKTFTILSTGGTQFIDASNNTVNLTGAGTVQIQFGANGAKMQSSGGTGTFNVNAGVLTLRGGSSSTITYDSSLAINVPSTGILDFTPNSSGTLCHYNMAVNLNGGSLRIGSGNPTVSGPVNLVSDSTITAGATTYIGTIAGVISGSGKLTKTVGNIDYLTAVNTYTGNTTVSAGTLIVTNAGVLGSGNYAGNIVNNATFAYAGSSAQTLSGVISGTGTLAKDNSSTLTLTGVNTYTNATTIVSGNLTISGAGQLGSGNYAGNIVNKATLVYASSAPQTLSGIISGTGALVESGSGALILTGTNTYTGATIVNGSVLSVTNGALADTAITVNNGATFAVQPGNATAISLGNTLTAGAGATLNLGTNTFDMTDGAISTCALQQEATFAGPALTLAGGATLKFNLGNSSADLLAVSTAASVSGTINVSLNVSTATAWTGAPTFTILTAASGLDGGTWTLTSPQVTVGGNLFNLALAHTATAVTVTATPAYTVTYNGNGNTGGTTPVDTNSPYSTGSTVTVLGPFTLVKTGYAFSGWNTAFDGSGTAYLPGSTFSIGANTTLYAQWAPATATITVASTLPGALTTIYGTASSPQSVSVAGSSLTANITATSTNSSLEISSDGVTYGPTATFTQSGGSVSGTLYVRLTSNAPVSGNYNSLGIYLSTAGASTVTTATTASGNVVSAKALTVASATAQNKLHDGTTTALVTGMLQSSEAFGAGNSSDGMPYTGDSLTVSSPSGNFASSAVGTWTVTPGTFTLGGASAGNYTLTQPSFTLTATILSSGIWTNTVALATWGTAANWTNNIIATNVDNTADFSQVDITSDVTVNLTTPMTIGNLIFGNTDASPAANWVVTNNSVTANILTLADSATTPTITVTNLGTGNTVIYPAIAGTAGLTKNGNGLLVLRGANTYTGNTTISGGTFRIGNGGQLSGGTYVGNITNNGAFVHNNAAAQTLSGVISGTGSVAETGGGTLTLSGNNTYSGGTSNSSGYLTVASANALGFGPAEEDTSAIGITINDGLTVTNDFNLNGGSGAYAGLIMNSGSGNATLSGGTITINGAPATGGDFAGAGTGTLTIADPVNSTLAVVWRSGNGIFSGGGSYPSFNITGNVMLGANNGLAQSATVNVGVSAAGTLDLAGYNQTLAGITRSAANSSTIINNSASADSTLTTTGTSTYPGTIADGSAHKVAMTVNGGQLTLSGTNTYTGNTTLTSGILTVGSPESAGPKGPLGTGGSIVFNGGQLQYSTANSNDYSARFSTAASQAYSIDTAGQAVTFATGLTSSSGSLTVADSTASTGTLILSGTSTYSGATTVSSGKLYVNGALNSASAVSVPSSSATLGGQGSVGAVTVSSSGNIEGGQVGVGALTMGSLNFTDSGYVTVRPNVTTAPVSVTAFNGLNPAGGASTVTINLSGGALPQGTYHLIQYSGSIQGSGFGAFTLGTNPGGAYTYALVNNTGYVDLQVTALADIWTGAFSTEWSVNPITSPKNWTVTGVGPVDYADGQDVLFNDSATGTTVNISVADVNPNSVQFFNSSKNYTLQGSHGIASINSGGLVKNGTGTVTINNTNSFSGDVTINAGAVSVSDMEIGSTPSPLGAGYNIYLGGGKLSYTGAGSSSDRTVTLNANSTLEVTAAPATLTLSGSVAGTASLTKAGSGTLALTGAGNYTGNTTINAGTLAIADPGLLGSGTYTGNITNNGAFVYSSSSAQTLAGVISGAGTMAQSGVGSLTLSGVNTYTANTTINGGTLTIGGSGQLGSGTYAGNITNNASLVLNSSASQILSGNITGSGSLTVSGTGALTLSGANSYTNGTSVSAGAGLVTVQNNQSAANGGWTIGGATGAGAAATVNFDASSTVGISSIGQIVVGSTTGGGTAGQTLNVAGTVNNNGTINVTRVGAINLNTGAIWNQTGDINLNGVGGYSAALNVYAGAAMTYSGVDLVQINAAPGNHGNATLTIDSTGVFTTSTGFEETTTPAAGGGYGQVLLSNGGKLKLTADVPNLTTQVQFNLAGGAGVIDNGGHNVSLSGIVTQGALAGGIFGPGSLTTTGGGTLTLTGTNTYSGDTIINGGTLAVSATGTLGSSPNIIIAGGAMLDVSASTLTLGSGRVLTNISTSAVLNGNITNVSGGMLLNYASGSPSFIVTNGTLTLGTNTVFRVSNTGAALAVGNYALISPATTGNVGLVAGTSPTSVTVAGNGLASGTAASLAINSGELDLVVTTSVNTMPTNIVTSVSSNNLTLTWPADHTGWRLLAQTNHLTTGVSKNTNDWGTVAGSVTTNRMVISINPALPAEFYRLVYP